MSLTERMFAGVFPGWLELFRGPLADGFAAAVSAVSPDADRLAPPADLVLDAFRYFEPSQTRVVIIGQDPYPGSTAPIGGLAVPDAVGLCFSTAGPVPPSLVNVMSCLSRHGLASPPAPLRGDLACWAVQGVLMLNATLTTRLGESKAHVAHWKGFTRALVQKLAELPQRVVFMLWGQDAQNYAGFLRNGESGPADAGRPKCPGHVVLQWTHPSPTCDNRLPDAAKFVNCPHFVESATAVGPTVWDPSVAVFAFTDGACQANGKPSAVASYAVAVVSGPARKTRVSGLVPRKPCRLLALPAGQFRVRTVLDGADVTPTNNRGELLAICVCLAVVASCRTTGPVVVVTDSKLAIGLLTAWYPDRKARGSEAGLANLDLIEIAHTLATKVSAKFVHVRGHAPFARRTAEHSFKKARFMWLGNSAVDALAGSAIRDRTEYEISTDVALLRREPICGN